MVADVLATGNHYLLDIVGSGALLIASIAIATWWARLDDRRFRPTLGQPPTTSEQLALPVTQRTVRTHLDLPLHAPLPG